LAVGNVHWLAASLGRFLDGAIAALAARDSGSGRQTRWAAAPAALLGAAIAVVGGCPTAVWLMVGLQQAYHAPFYVEGRTVRLGPQAALLERIGLTRRRWWRLDPWAGPPAQLSTYWRDRYRPDPSPGDRVAAQQAQAYLGRLDGDLLSEDMSFTVTAGRRIYVQPFEFTQLAEQNVFDQRPLLDALSARRFAAVVLRWRLGDDPGFHIQRVNRPMIAAIQEAYRLDASYGSYYIYRPLR
jgi:hypothetical protein